MSSEPENKPNEEPAPTDTSTQINEISGGAVAIGSGAVATAVYHGLTTAEVADLLVQLKHKDQPKVWDGRIPYLGLTPFRQRDAQYFFGRESLVDRLLDRVPKASFIAIAGPSGSGKSSVARAGLFHALTKGRLEGSDSWLLGTMQPEGNPLEELAVAVGRMAKTPAAAQYIRQEAQANPTALAEQLKMLLSDDARQRCVLLVDQFEEIFTQTKDEEERAAFINLLTTAAQEQDGRTLIIISLRSDFISHCVRYDKLSSLISDQLQLVGAMKPADLAKAITLPSLVVGSEIEAELVSRIMNDMKGEPGALPLMSFALLDLFEAEKTKEGQAMDLTLQEYFDRGGIESALERHANLVFDDFSAEQKELARGIFTKLINVGEGRTYTRRTAAFAELVPAGATKKEVSAVIGKLTQEKVRLITTSGVETDEQITQEQIPETTVTIAHEKLIEAWPWLRQLVNDNREIIALQNQIHSDAQSWAENEDPSYLYTGGRLAQVEDRLEAIQPNLDVLSDRFIAAAIAAREAQAQAEADRIREQEKIAQERANADRIQRLNRRLKIAAVVAVIATILALIFMVLAQQESKQVAALKTSIQASQLAQASRAELDQNQELALLLALTGQGLSNQPDTIARLYDALLTPYRRTLIGHEGLVRWADISPDGTRIVTASDDNSAKVWDLDGNELASLDWHDDLVNTAVFSPDGTQIVTASNDGSAKLWDLQAVDDEGMFKFLADYEIASLDGHTDWVNTAFFSPDGSQIVTASEDNSAKLWDLEGNELASLDGHTNSVNTAVFSPDGTQIITAGNDGSAKLWDLDGNEIASLDGHLDAIRSAVFSPDGKQILTAGFDGFAIVWDLNGNEITSLDGHDSSINMAVFSPDGMQIVTAGFDSSAIVWDLNGSETAFLEGHKAPVWSVGFSPDGSQILTTSLDGSAKVWDLNGAEIASLNGHTDYVRSAVFSPGGSLIVTASDDGRPKLWDLQGNEQISIDRHTSLVNSAVFSPDGNEIVTASFDGSARRWDLQGNELASLIGHTDSVAMADFSADGAQIVTAASDNDAILWEPNGNIIAFLEGHTDLVKTAVFSPDETQILTASDDGSAKLWDLAGNELAALEGHTDWVRTAVFSPDGTQILTASDDGSAKLWDLKGNERVSLDGHSDWVYWAVFSPDGTQILTASEDNSAKLWDLEGNELASLDGHLGAVNTAVFNPDGSQIVTASWDNSAKLWDLEGNKLASLDGHIDTVRTAVFSPDGSQIVTASNDRSAKLWDLEGNELASLDGHSDKVNTAVFSPDGTQILTAGDDGSAKLWTVPESYEGRITVARSRVTRGFTEAECLQFFPDDPDICPQTAEAIFALLEDDLN